MSSPQGTFRTPSTCQTKPSAHLRSPSCPDKDQLIMVYCRSGRRSKEASEKLVKLGYTNIVEFGGILDWKGETVTGQK